MAPVCRRCGARLPELASFSLPTPNPWLILYRFVWLSFLTFIIVRLIVYNRRFGQITPDPVIRLTTLAMVVAGLFALGVIATTMADLRLGGPTVARFVVSVSAYWRLSPLWRAVTAEVPEVVLPTALSWGDVIRHRRISTCSSSGGW